MNTVYLLSISFLFSSIMSYIVAKGLVTSPAGTAAFNEQLGQMTLYSYPIIALPSMIMMMGIFYYLWRTISSLTGLKLDDVMAQPPEKK